MKFAASPVLQAFADPLIRERRSYDLGYAAGLAGKPGDPGAGIDPWSFYLGRARARSLTLPVSTGTTT